MIGAALLSLTAVGLLSLAMPRHWRQLANKSLPTIICRLLQMAGYVLLVLCLWRFTDGNQYEAGWVIGLAAIILIAAGWSLSFSLWPRITAVIAFFAGVFGLLFL